MHAGSTTHSLSHLHSHTYLFCVCLSLSVCPCLPVCFVSCPARVLLLVLRLRSANGSQHCGRSKLAAGRETTETSRTRTATGTGPLHCCSECRAVERGEASVPTADRSRAEADGEYHTSVSLLVVGATRSVLRVTCRRPHVASLPWGAGLSCPRRTRTHQCAWLAADDFFHACSADRRPRRQCRQCRSRRFTGPPAALRARRRRRSTAAPITIARTTIQHGSATVFIRRAISPV